MKNKTYKFLICLLLVSFLFAFTGCNKEKEEDAEITMYIGLGNTNSEYYSKIHEAILENTGIDVKFVYSNTNDTTNAIKLRIKNYDLPADIIVTASYTDTEYQENAFLDLAKCTNIPDLFKSTTIKSCSVNGSVYQLPYTTRLIGITYNKTLFEELGWELPSNLNEMIALKEKADAEGINFSVSGGIATGHGFNYLFYLLGTDYLSSPDGTKWLSDFKNGAVNADQFEEACEYFEKFADAGLFGSFHSSDWKASTEFQRTRALFYINITNDCYSYDGPLYDEEGNVIEGTEVHDTYASMPWLSEDGLCNSYVLYNSMYVALDKKLEQEENSAKLEKAVKVLEFLASDTAISVFTDMFPDGYVGVNNFEIDESRLYYDYADTINRGFVISWYYNDFDSDTIVNVGDLVNKYIAGTDGVTLNDIIDELEYQNDLTISGSLDASVEVKKEFDYEDVAKLEAAVNAITLSKQGVDVTVSLMPYTDDIAKLPLYKSLGVVQQKLYKGTFSLSETKAIVNSYTATPVAVTMTGAELKAFASAGYDISEDYENIQEGYTVFPYAMVVRSGMTIADDKTYIVAIPMSSMPKSVYQKFLDEGKITLGDSGKPVTGNLESGLTSYLFENYKTISPEDFIW